MHGKKLPIAQLTTFQSQGYIQQVWDVVTLEDLESVKKKYPHSLLLGKGSNTVLNPKTNLDGIIRLSPKMTTPHVTKHQLTVGAGTTVHQLLSLTTTHELSGLEFTAGVPASVGGMVVMNFGCWGYSLSDVIHAVYVRTAPHTYEWLTAKDCHFSYRHSIFQENHNWQVLAATFNLTPAPKTKLRQDIKNYIKQRAEKQPLRVKSFGSIFKNPEQHKAAALIDAVGFKGYCYGGVQISPHHANFMMNRGQATYQDVKETIATIKKDWFFSQI